MKKINKLRHHHIFAKRQPQKKRTKNVVKIYGTTNNKNKDEIKNCDDCQDKKKNNLHKIGNKRKNWNIKKAYQCQSNNSFGLIVLCCCRTHCVASNYNYVRILLSAPAAIAVTPNNIYWILKKDLFSIAWTEDEKDGEIRRQTFSMTY